MFGCSLLRKFGLAHFVAEVEGEIFARAFRSFSLLAIVDPWRLESEDRCGLPSNRRGRDMAGAIEFVSGRCSRAGRRWLELRAVAGFPAPRRLNLGAGGRRRRYATSVSCRVGVACPGPSSDRLRRRRWLGLRGSRGRLPGRILTGRRRCWRRWLRGSTARRGCRASAGVLGACAARSLLARLGVEDMAATRAFERRGLVRQNPFVDSVAGLTTCTLNFDHLRAPPHQRNNANTSLAFRHPIESASRLPMRMPSMRPLPSRSVRGDA